MNDDFIEVITFYAFCVYLLESKGIIADRDDVIIISAIGTR